MSGYLELPLGIYVPERRPALSRQMEIAKSCNGEGIKSVFLFQTEVSHVFLFKHLERSHKAVFQFYLIQLREETPSFTGAAKYFDGTLTT